MMNVGDKYIVRAWDSNCAEQPYDMLVSVVGYESRARFAAERLPAARQQLAFGFDANRVLAYEYNLKWFMERNFEIVEGSDELFRAQLASSLRAASESANRPRIVVDISSLTRKRIAIALWQVIQHLDIIDRCDFVYSVAEYTKPPAQSEVVSHFGAVLPEFAGWPAHPQRPMVLVLGLGYEADRALGAAELLEPADCWALLPRGIDKMYDRRMDAANMGLAEILRGPDRQVEYPVDRPFETYLKLRSLVDGLVRHGRHRAIILPFGPKIFALCALLVQTVFSSVGVWRVSSSQLQHPTDREPSGKIIGLSVAPRDSGS